MPNDLDMLQHSYDTLAEAMTFVEPDALSSATPCDDWSVSDLLDHVTGGNRFTVNILSGMAADEALDRARWSFGDDHDPVAAVDSSSHRQLDAFGRHGALDGTYHHVVGDLRGDQVLRLRLHDVAIHTWDLLQAVHPNALDPVYVRWAIEELSQPDSLTAKHIATAVVHPTNSHELLRAFGRDRT